MSKPFGRPPKYKPEFCQMLIDHMAKGLSFESFAGEMTTTRKTIYNWAEQYPDFLHAKEIGFEMSRAYYEKAGAEGLWNTQGEGARNLNNTAWVFNLKNRFPKEWRDRTEVEKTEIEHIKITIDKDDEQF